MNIKQESIMALEEGRMVPMLEFENGEYVRGQIVDDFMLAEAELDYMRAMNSHSIFEL